MAARSREVTLSTGVSTKEPSELTKLELWEFGRKLLGYGDWTPEHPEPYQKWSGMESHKLFLVMRKRKISNDEFVLCVRYCQRHHKRIENAVWVFRFISEAKQELREALKSKPSGELAIGVDEALRYERALAAEDSKTWISKLTRAVGPYREEVLNDWRAARAERLGI